jgi:alkanesulfonate monooxygenase SsuD/methylene tetrahydromethanopterin reductase-like flavin-dependent oxidoreductase (luciferase family)
VTYAVDLSSHHPSWLAKRATTVDHLSNGGSDLRLGIGAEDHATRDRRVTAFRIRGPSAARLEEAVDVMRALWQGGPVDRRGRFSTLSSALGGPPPVQRPGRRCGLRL